MGQILSTLFAGFGITDVIDIAIVSFIIYKVIGFIRSTRAAQLTKGIIVIVVATAVSSLLNLYIVKWILTNLLSVGLVALVVVFQPEHIENRHIIDHFADKFPCLLLLGLQHLFDAGRFGRPLFGNIPALILKHSQALTGCFHTQKLLNKR